MKDDSRHYYYCFYLKKKKKKKKNWGGGGGGGVKAQFVCNSLPIHITISVFKKLKYNSFLTTYCFIQCFCILIVYCVLVLLSCKDLPVCFINVRVPMLLLST